jgi:phage terminase large subunit-like protein
VASWPPKYFTPAPYPAEEADDIIEFIEGYCRIVKDSNAGRRGDLMVLEDWQKELIRNVFCRDEDGSYLFSQALFGVPKKNGKSGIGSSFGLYHVLFGPNGGEVYSCAGSKEQAAIVFDTAKQMVELDEEFGDGDLFEQIKIYRNSLVVPATGSIYRVLSSEAKLQDGLNPTFIIFDELHTQPNDELWTIMTQGEGARREYMTFAITTAGVKNDSSGNDSLCYQKYQYGKRIVEGEVDDPHFFFGWYEPLDGEDADASDRNIWIEANPGFGTIKAERAIESSLKRDPESIFRTKHLNQWVASKESAFKQGVFEACGDPREVPLGSEIILGFDGAYTGDCTALVGCTVEDPYVFVIKLWERPLDDPNWHVPVLEVEAEILQACRDYFVREIACDPYRWQRTMSVLDEEGLPVVSWPTASIARMGPAYQKFYDAVVDGELKHSGDPALIRHIGNMVLKRDARGVRPTKETQTSPRKIDAAIAAIIAFDRATASAGAVDPLELVF